MRPGLVWSGEVAVTPPPRPYDALVFASRLVVSEVPRPDSTRAVHTLRCEFGPKGRARHVLICKTNRVIVLQQPPNGLWAHQRFTRPIRDVVTLAVCPPRRSMTRVFEAPTPIPMAPKVTV